VVKIQVEVSWVMMQH